MAYDIHAHCVPEPLLDVLESRSSDFDTTLVPGASGPIAVMGGFRGIPIGDDLVSQGTRLAAMDRQGVEVQVLSPFIDLTGYELEIEKGVEWSRIYNDALRAEVDRVPGRFEMLANVPLQDGASAAAELRRVVVELGGAGVQVGSRAGDRLLDDPDLEQFWAAASELRCLVLLHPRDPLRGLEIDDYMIRHLVGRPAETTIAAARLVLGGVLDRHPDVRIVVVHGGGFLPYQIGRLVQGYERPREISGIVTETDPRRALTRLYYDTILNEPKALRALVDLVGRDRVLLGSDYPYTLGDQDPVRSVEAIPDADDQVKDAILAGNLRRLIGEVRRSIRPGPSTP